jgi:2-C-methyl-D-erythritol 2,4-cyclodiphosphate synthase
MLRIGQGYDAHRFKEGGQLILGGVAVEYDRSMAAHSDGDVALHALCDALLGAAGLGDIGRHFPDTDLDFKGIDSRILLREVCAKLAAEGYAVVNVDVTIVAQRPRLAPYIESMRANIAADLRIAPGFANVKATTTEGMGFEGRGEGISSYAVALIEKK